jgi:uncharacterized membrane protein
MSAHDVTVHAPRPAVPPRGTPRPRVRRHRGAFWWFALTSVGIAVMAVLPYLTASLETLARDGAGLAANYVTQPDVVRVALYVHATTAGVALALSPLQFAARLRRRAPRLHRAVGRVVLGAIAVSAPAGLVLAPVNSAGPVGFAGFGLLGILWFACATAAFRTARRRDFAAHRRWAVRVFALTYAGVMLRLTVMVGVNLQVWLTGVDPDVAWDRTYLVTTFGCWVPNLLVAEYYLRRGGRRAVA